MYERESREIKSSGFGTDILEVSEPYEAPRDRSAVEAFRMQLELRGVLQKQ